MGVCCEELCIIHSVFSTGLLEKYGNVMNRYEVDEDYQMELKIGQQEEEYTLNQS